MPKTSAAETPTFPDAPVPVGFREFAQAYVVELHRGRSIRGWGRCSWRGRLGANMRDRYSRGRGFGKRGPSTVVPGVWLGVPASRAFPFYFSLVQTGVNVCRHLLELGERSVSLGCQLILNRISQTVVEIFPQSRVVELGVLTVAYKPREVLRYREVCFNILRAATEFRSRFGSP
jgi:hypothetical protein